MEVPVSATNEAQKEATKMDTDDAANDTASGADVNMPESKNETAEGTEDGTPASEEKSVPMDTDAKVVYCLHVDCSLLVAIYCRTRSTVLCGALS